MNSFTTTLRLLTVKFALEIKFVLLRIWKIATNPSGCGYILNRGQFELGVNLAESAAPPRTTTTSPASTFDLYNRPLQGARIGLSAFEVPAEDVEIHSTPADQWEGRATPRPTIVGTGHQLQLVVRITSLEQQLGGWGLGRGD